MFSASTTDVASAFVGWIDSLVCAMVDKITLEIGSDTIEEITGDLLDTYITS